MPVTLYLRKRNPLNLSSKKVARKFYSSALSGNLFFKIPQQHRSNLKLELRKVNEVAESVLLSEDFHIRFIHKIEQIRSEMRLC